MQNIFKHVDDSILGKGAMVALIIAATMYHRIAGIIVLIMIIAFMQNSHTNITEGFAFPSTPVSSGTTSSSLSSSSDTWNSPDEFKQKFCTKQLIDGVDESLVDVVSPNSKLVTYDSSGKVTGLGESYSRIDYASVGACGIYKNPVTGKDQSGGFAQLCDPKCNWKMK